MVYTKIAFMIESDEGLPERILRARALLSDIGIADENLALAKQELQAAYRSCASPDRNGLAGHLCFALDALIEELRSVRQMR